MCRLLKALFFTAFAIKYITYKMSEHYFTNDVHVTAKKTVINSINQVLFNKATSKELKKRAKKVKSSSLFSLAKSI